jgi:hypothetical protein
MLCAVWPLLLVTFVSGCGLPFGPSLRGSGIARTEAREVAPFSEIEIGGTVQLDAEVGPENSLVVTTDDNILPYVVTVVEGERLRIYIDSPCSTKLGIKVTATAPVLRALEASGASKAMVSGITGEQFKLEVSGASRCELAGDAELVDVSLSGASQSKIAGTAKQLKVESSGASRLDAKGLNAAIVVAELNGASNSHVHVTDQLTANVSGASTLQYDGQPEKVIKHTSGASTVRPE